MEKIRFIEHGNYQNWQFYDERTGVFRSFLKTLAGSKLVVMQKDFFVIQDCFEKPLLFEFDQSVPVHISGDFYNFSRYNPYPLMFGKLEQRNHVIYVFHCRNRKLCYCVLICGDKLFFVKDIGGSEKRENVLIHYVFLMDGRRIKITRPIQVDDKGVFF